MRSNDIWLGLPYDMAFFTVILQIVAKATGLTVGRYYHTVGDLHLYERHWRKPVKDGYIYSEFTRTLPEWDYTLETKESIQDMLDGKEPKNPVLRKLWVMNHADKE